MARAFSSSRTPGVVLFDDDFDLPAPPPEPEVIEPVYSAAELLAAREEAARESRDIALAEAATSARAMAGQALAEITAQIVTARSETASVAEQSAEAIARLLMRCFATAFPALSARHGETEVTAVLRAILPMLHREPKITVRVSPKLIAALTEELQTVDSDVASGVRLIPTDTMAAGDARVSWEHGAATRDAASLWSQIENILAPAGLLDPVEPAHAGHTAKEQALVD
jgi:flagellar assembly protein FliH